MLILFNNLNNNTDRNEDTITDDTSEGMSPPLPQKNEAVSREGEDDESSSDINYKDMCSFG